MNKKLVIFGDGEIADLAFFYFSKQSDYKICAFVADETKNNSFNSLPLISTNEVEKEFPKDEYYIHIALSYKKLNKNRQEKFEFFDNKNYKFASFISNKATILTETNNLGRNLFILEEQSIQTGVKIMDNVMIWSNNHIGHNTTIGKHTYISSNVTLSGHFQIGERCFFGVSSSVADFTKIGDDCFITMGSVINSNLKNGSTTVNKSTEIYKSDNRISKVLKKKYFDN